jgi:hypothetical protein
LTFRNLPVVGTLARGSKTSRRCGTPHLFAFCRCGHASDARWPGRELHPCPAELAARPDARIATMVSSACLTLFVA